MDADTSVAGNGPIRVLVVDDHQISRQGLIFAIEQEADLRCVGEASSGAEAIVRVQELNSAVDVIVMDVQMQTPTDGVDTAAKLHAQWPECRVLVLTSSRQHASAARKAGVTGYVLKGSHIHDILAAIRAVQRGALYFEVAPDKGVVLSDAEVKVLDLIADGLTNGEIGLQLGWSARAVTTHVGNILDKLGANRREQAVRFGMRQGMIQ